MNKVILMGRMTKDAELSQSPSGVFLTRFSIAVNRRFAKDGQQQADFLNCIAWRQAAENICKFFKKGSMIAITGSIQTRSWDGQDGKKQYATDIVVDEFYFTGSKAESGTNGGDYSFTAPQAPATPAASAGGFDEMGFSMDDSEDDLPF